MEHLTAEQIIEKHPLPWTAHSLMIKDANGRQVIHLGGAQAERGSHPEDPYYLAGLNALLVELANKTLRFKRPPKENPPTDPLQLNWINHERGGWSWEFTDRECTDPVVLAGHDHDILLLTTDDVGRYIIEIDDDHQTLLAHAFMVPHECGDSKCPGNIIRERFDALKAAESLKLDHFDDLDVKAEKIDILKILLSEFEYWKNVDAQVSIGAIGALSNCIAAITTDYRAPWHPRTGIAALAESLGVFQKNLEAAKGKEK